MINIKNIKRNGKEFSEITSDEDYYCLVYNDKNIVRGFSKVKKTQVVTTSHIIITGSKQHCIAEIKRLKLIVKQPELFEDDNQKKVNTDINRKVQ